MNEITILTLCVCDKFVTTINVRYHSHLLKCFKSFRQQLLLLNEPTGLWLLLTSSFLSSNCRSVSNYSSYIKPFKLFSSKLIELGTNWAKDRSRNWPKLTLMNPHVAADQAEGRGESHFTLSPTFPSLPLRPPFPHSWEERAQHRKYFSPSYEVSIQETGLSTAFLTFLIS